MDLKEELKGLPYKEYRKILELMYFDRLTLYRPVDIYDEDMGASTQSLEPIPEVQNIRCKLSQTDTPDTKQGEEINLVNHNQKLFISPDIDLIQGDKVEIHRGAKIEKYTLGAPYKHRLGDGFTHQEISIEMKGWA